MKKHPLIVYLRKIAGWHRGCARVNRDSAKTTPREYPAIRAFYQDAARLHVQAADLIEQAVRRFPISTPKKGGKR